jgi:hypothetical protein
MAVIRSMEAMLSRTFLLAVASTISPLKRTKRSRAVAS